LIPLLLLALLLISCTADSESYTAPRINPDEALNFVPSSGISWPTVTNSEFYSDPRINPDEALGDD
jgi:hypothetical protein